MHFYLMNNVITNTLEPFWASNPTEASGRDPLGIKYQCGKLNQYGEWYHQCNQAGDVYGIL